MRILFLKLKKFNSLIMKAWKQKRLILISNTWVTSRLKLFIIFIDEHKDSIVDIPTNIMRRINAQSSRFIKWANTLIQSFSTFSKSTLKE